MAELAGQGPIIHSGATTVVDSTQAIKLGLRAQDVDGNEYVYVDFQEACVRGEWVSFDTSYAAVQLTSTAVGWVGIVVGTVSASDRFGWVQVRGVCTRAFITSGSSVGPITAYVTTDIGTVTVSAATGGVAIFGVAMVAAPDTCASTGVDGGAGTSAVGISTVYLNYPFITGAIAQATS